MRMGNKHSYQTIIDYIGESYSDVPYLYTNLVQYEVENKNSNVHVWLDINGSTEATIQGVYLRYFNCLHFFTRLTDYPTQRLLHSIESTAPSVIMLDKYIGESIANKISHSYLFTKEITYYHPCNSITEMIFHNDFQVEFAKREDILEIVRLLLIEKLFQSVYTFDELTSQLSERFDDGYGRLFLIRDRNADNKVVAAAGINGENDKFIFHGSLVTHPGYRKRGFAKQLLSAIISHAANRGKPDMAFITSDNVVSQRLHEDMGFRPISMIYKFTKR